jgi:hypothetical protein
MAYSMEDSRTRTHIWCHIPDPDGICRAFFEFLISFPTSPIGTFSIGSHFTTLPLNMAATECTEDAMSLKDGLNRHLSEVLRTFF